jgi:hypothetical protein
MVRRLLTIEWRKSVPSRYFRIMVGIWGFAFFALPLGFKLFLEYLERQGFSLDQLPGVTATDLPIFDFVDIWQNLAYIYKCISIFLALLIIINITNELDYKTFRQNIIDGMSKGQFLGSKLLLMVCLATGAAFMVLLGGLIIGYIASPVTEWHFVVKHINFVAAYWLHIMVFLSLSMLLSLLIKRAGITIALLLFWMFIVEPIGATILEYGLKAPLLADILPMQGHWNLIPRPIEKYGLAETRYWVSTQSVVIATTQLCVYLTAIWLLLTKRDVR